jgi:uncharacterized membrane protein YgdD (TMEM256/DUF423 family)
MFMQQFTGTGVRRMQGGARSMRYHPRIQPRHKERDMHVDRLYFATGAIFAAIAVAAGAFGAHGLKARISPDMLAVFEVGARYHMYHALALMACAWAATRWPGGLVAAAFFLFVAGTLVFSGSLYALALTGARWLGALTPLGGVAFLAGWLCLALAALKPSA